MNSLPRLNTSRPACAGSLALLSAFLLSSSLSAATVIVDWGGEYVTANTEFGNKFTNSNTNDPSGYGGFVDGDALSLVPSAGYAGTSGNIHGSILEVGLPGSYGASLGQFNGIVHNSTSDRIQLKGDDGINPTSFLLLWNQADFLNDASSADIAFDATSSLRLNLITLAGQNATDSGRLVLQLGGGLYVSEQIFTATGDTTYGGATLTGLDFYHYDPVTSLNVNNASIGSTASISAGGVINGITGIGFYFESDDTATADAVRIQDFEVTATVSTIPEPSAAAFLGGAGALALALLGRRKRLG